MMQISLEDSFRQRRVERKKLDDIKFITIRKDRLI